MDTHNTQTGIGPIRPKGLDDWEARKDVIADLYSKMDLGDIMEKMKIDHGFLATYESSNLITRSSY